MSRFWRSGSVGSLALAYLTLLAKEFPLSFWFLGAALVMAVLTGASK